MTPTFSYKVYDMSMSVSEAICIGETLEIEVEHGYKPNRQQQDRPTDHKAPHIAGRPTAPRHR